MTTDCSSGQSSPAHVIAVVSGTAATVWLLAAVRVLLQVVVNDKKFSPWYGVAGVCWTNGIGMFMLTVGLIAHSKVGRQLAWQRQ